jgi:hypothetical protein
VSATDAFVDELAKRVAKLVLDGLRAGSDAEWVDQHASALGPRRHAAAVRRRLGAGEGGAAQVGRRFLLTPTAVQEELKRPARERKAADADGAALAAELGLRLVGGKK